MNNFDHGRRHLEYPLVGERLGRGLGEVFPGGEGGSGCGGGGGDSVVLRRGLEDSTPFNQSTVPDKEINSKRKINERFITRRFGVLMTTLSSRDVNNITIEQMQEARRNNLHNITIEQMQEARINNLHTG